MTGVRLILKDHQWARMEPHLPGKSSDPAKRYEAWGDGACALLGPEDVVDGHLGIPALRTPS